MRDFTFVFENRDAVIDFNTGLRVPVAFTVAAPGLEEALVKLAAHGSDLGWSDDPADYQSDIDNTNISVLLPTRIG